MDDMPIQFHTLKQAHKLNPHTTLINQVSNLAVKEVATKIPIKNVDIVFYANPSAAIPELGIGGYAATPYTIFISLDPSNKNLKQNIKSYLPGTIAHELYHCIRGQSLPSRKHNLLEAMITEGLSDLFAIESTHNRPYPWDTALTPTQLKNLLAKAKRECFRQKYNHHDWFFGSKSRKIPRWTGYTLGYNLVKQYLEEHPKTKPSTLYNQPAREFTKKL